MFEKGKLYKVRSWSSMENEYGVDREGDIDLGGGYFVSPMDYLCGGFIGVTHLFSDDTLMCDGWLIYYKAFEFMS